MRTEDGCIIQECLNGKPEAFGMLVDKYKAGIYAFAYGRLGNFQDAEDVTQEVFVEAYRGLRSLRRWESFVFWIYRIVRNHCVDWDKTQSRRPDREFIADQDLAILEAPSLNSYRADRLNESLRETLDLLPETYREVLMLHYFAGMTSREIAKAVGTSPTAVRMRLSRARSQLREEMTAMMDTAFEGQRLQASFTFRVVEAVRRIKIPPMPRVAGLPWGLSLAAGITITVLSLNPHLSILNPASFPTCSPLPVEAKALKTGEIPVDILEISEKWAIGGERSDIAEEVLFAPTRVASSEGWIVFARGERGNRNIWVMDANGGQKKQLTFDGIDDRGPAWSPDGKRIAFWRWQDDAWWDIYVVDANGSGIKRLTRGPENDIHPTWSPDGKQIAFTREFWEQKDDEWTQKSWAIYVINTDGSGLRQLGELVQCRKVGQWTSSGGYPAWSPDGSQIAYYDWPVDRSAVCVMDANGGNRKTLYWWGGNWGIDWSPDGDRIVFASSQDSWQNWGTNDIYAIDVNGKNLKRLTQPSPAWYSGPRWSPDGTKISFYSWEDENPIGIYVMNANGSDVRGLTNAQTIAEMEFWPDWTAFLYSVEPAGKLPTKWGEVKSE